MKITLWLPLRCVYVPRAGKREREKEGGESGVEWLAPEQGRDHRVDHRIVERLSLVISHLQVQAAHPV